MDGSHPAACVQEGKPTALRKRPVLQAVPRTSKDTEENRSDVYAVHTVSGCTPYLDREGWFLVRFMKAVPIKAFCGFGSQAYMGTLSVADGDRLREMIKTVLLLPPR